MIKWQFFPKSDYPNPKLMEVISIFKSADDKISSDSKNLSSNEVLKTIKPDLEASGFEVEKGKSASEKINVPVLFGLNGTLEKSFDADAYHRESRIVMEVEAGRGVLNNQFLKDLFQACMMKDVDFLVIAVRKIYLDTNRDFDTVYKFLDTLYANGRLKLPLKGVLLIGY